MPNDEHFVARVTQPTMNSAALMQLRKNGVFHKERNQTHTMGFRRQLGPTPFANLRNNGARLSALPRTAFESFCTCVKGGAGVQQKSVAFRDFNKLNGTR